MYHVIILLSDAHCLGRSTWSAQRPGNTLQSSPAPGEKGMVGRHVSGSYTQRVDVSRLV